MKSEAEKLQLSEEIIVKIEAQVEAKVKQGMIEITKEIRANYQSNNDDARCNELEIQLRQELTVMAKRLNQGALYEIKAGLPNMPEEPVALAGSELGVKEVKAYENEMSEYQRKLDNVRKINAVNELIVEVSNAMIENQNILLLDYDKLKD